MAESEIIFNVEETPEGGYTARALGHSILTEADTLEELRAMVRDAVLCHFQKSGVAFRVYSHRKTGACEIWVVGQFGSAWIQ